MQENPCNLRIKRLYDNVKNAYEVALKEGYRFGLYGDAMLIID